MSRFKEAKKSRIAGAVSRRIEKYGLPRSWERECCYLYEEFAKSRNPNIGNPTKLIDSILLLLCRRKHFIEPKELVKATRGTHTGKTLHFFRVLEKLDGLAPTIPEDYIRKFFSDNPEFEEFLQKSLDIATRLPKNFQGKNPRILASVCIYISSIGRLYGRYRPIITQREVADYFKVTEMGIKNVYHELLPKLKVMNTMLSEKEIEWLLSFKKARARGELS